MVKRKVSAPLVGGQNSKFQIPNWAPKAAHFTALAVIFSVSAWAFVHFEGSLFMQLYVVVAAVVAYDVWGMIYHYFRRRLTLDLVMEYLLVGALVILLFFWTLFS